MAHSLSGRDARTKTMRLMPNSARVVRRKPNTPGPSALIVMWRLTHPLVIARDEL